MLCSLPRVRSVVEISYGCMGRSDRQPRTARARGLDTRRRVILPPITRKRVSEEVYRVSSPRDDERPPTSLEVAGRGEEELPEVGDVDDQPLLAAGRAVEHEHAERQAGPHAEPEDRHALERAARGHLAEGAEAGHVHDVVR